MKRFGCLAAILGMLVIGGCGWFGPDPLVEEFNRRLPPTDLATVKLAQIEKAVNTLQQTAGWDAFVGISAREVEATLKTQLEAARSKLNEAGVTAEALAVRIENQAILVSGRVSARLRDPALTFTADVSGAAVPSAQGDSIEVRYALERVRLTELSWTGSLRPRDLSAALPILQGLVDRVLNNLNGAIQPTRIPVAISPIAPIDPTSLKVTDATVVGTPLALPQPRLANAVFLIDPSGLRALVDLALPDDAAQEEPTPGSTTPAPTTGVDQLFAVLKTRFGEAEAASFGAAQHDPQLSIRVALTRRLVARAFNLAAANLDWTLHLRPKPQSQSFDSEARLFKVPDPQTCTQKTDNRDCTPHTCHRSRDTRDCGICLIWRIWPGKGCAQRGNNPICEAAKAAQNVLYDAQYGGCELDAARLKGTCEAAKAGQNMLYASETAACQAGNTLVRELADLTGRVGRVSGTMDAKAGGTIAIRQLGATEAFDAMTVTTRVEAKADISARLSFVQSDLMGHLLCQFPMQGKTLNARASVGPDAIALTGRVVGTGGKPEIILSAVNIRFQLRPRPVEALFTQNPDLNITCAGAASLAWLGSGLQALGMKNLPEAFTGDFEETIGEQRLALELSQVAVAVPGRRAIVLQAVLRPAAIVFDAPPQP